MTRGFRNLSRVWPIVLVVAIGLTFANALHGPPIFDDYPAIVRNPNIEHLWPLSRALTAPNASGVDGRPLVCLSLAINYAISGYEAVGFHAFNIMVHGACALVLFGLIRRTMLLPRWAGRFDDHTAANFG